MKKTLCLILLSMLAVTAGLSAAPDTEVVDETTLTAATMFSPSWMLPQAAHEGQADLKLVGTCDQECQTALHACLQACAGAPGCFASCQGPYIACTIACTC